jgi:RND family efflux transporter MFP subunit
MKCFFKIIDPKLYGGKMKSLRSLFTTGRSMLPQCCLVVFSVLLLVGCDKKEEPKPVEVIRPVKLMKVQAGTVIADYSLPGQVRAARRAELSFKVSGPLVALPVEEGQHVKKGELIAQIQKRDFLTALEEARARALEAEKQFKRYKELYAKKQVSRADYDRYRAARDVARARLEDAANALKDTTLRAPFDGVIARRYVENFQKVQAKEPIVSLQDISRIEILVNVPELQMAALKEEGPGKVYAVFESIPGKKFPLTMKEFSTQADPATQTYQVVFVMSQPEEASILPGMTAMVTAETTRGVSGKKVIRIPAIAVMEGAGKQPYVWVYNEKSSTVHKQPVKVGRLTGSEDIFIEEGLKGGETIVVAGLTQLEEGMKVRPWEKQREFK